MRYGTCFLCGKTGWLEEHHVYPGPFRDKSEKYGLKVGLCGESCHRNGRYGGAPVQGNLRCPEAFWQIKYMMGPQSQRRRLPGGIREELSGTRLSTMMKWSYPMNIIAISGRLTRDPELRTTPNGKPVVEFIGCG